MLYILNTIALCLNIYWGIQGGPLSPIHWICVGISGAAIFILLVKEYSNV